MKTTLTHTITIANISRGIIFSPRKKKAKAEIRNGEKVSTIITNAIGANEHAIDIAANLELPKKSLVKKAPLASNGKSLRGPKPASQHHIVATTKRFN